MIKKLNKLEIPSFSSLRHSNIISNLKGFKKESTGLLTIIFKTFIEDIYVFNNKYSKVWYYLFRFLYFQFEK